MVNKLKRVQTDRVPKKDGSREDVPKKYGIIALDVKRINEHPETYAFLERFIPELYKTTPPVITVNDLTLHTHDRNANVIKLIRELIFPDAEITGWIKTNYDDSDPEEQDYTKNATIQVVESLIRGAIEKISLKLIDWKIRHPDEIQMIADWSVKSDDPEDLDFPKSKSTSTSAGPKSQELKDLERQDKKTILQDTTDYIINRLRAEKRIDDRVKPNAIFKRFEKGIRDTVKTWLKIPGYTKETIFDEFIDPGDVIQSITYAAISGR
jgi:hypothetical protein